MLYSIAAVLAASSVLVSVSAKNAFDRNARDPDWIKTTVNCQIPGTSVNLNPEGLFQFAVDHGVIQTQIDGLFGSWVAKPGNPTKNGPIGWLEMDFEYYHRDGKPAMSLTDVTTSWPEPGVSAITGRRVLLY